MATRFGNILYRLGTIIAVLAIGVAITWNGVTIFEHQQVQKELESLRAAKPDNKLSEVARIVEVMVSGGKTQAEIDDYIVSEGYTVAGVRRADDWRTRHQNLTYRVDDLAQGRETALFVGSVFVLGGLVAYVTGWLARYALKGPN